jgi:hypothetical protein
MSDRPPEQWPEWAKCPACRRNWNLSGSLSFAVDSRAAAEWYAVFHRVNCIGRAEDSDL